MMAILGPRLGLRVEESQGKPSHATQIKMLTLHLGGDYGLKK